MAVAPAEVLSYTPESDLPAFLRRDGGKLYYRDVEAEKTGPWDMVLNFERVGENLRQVLPIGEMRQVDQRVEFGENLAEGKINGALRNINILANKFNLGDPDVKLFYGLSFILGVKPQLAKALAELGTEDLSVWAPENGGGMLKLILGAMGVAREQMLEYKASRIEVGNNYTI